MLRVTGKGPNILAGDATFQSGRQFVGEAISIAFAEPANSGARWTIVVEAHLVGGGVFVVGSFVTRPPRAGDPSNRIVALCYVPGVQSWKLYLFGPKKASAQIAISTGKHSYGGNYALVPANGSQVVRTSFVPSPNVGVKTLQGIATTGPGTVLMGYGYQDPGAGGGNFIGFVDKATPIANGDLFIVAPIPIPAPVAGVAALVQWQFGDGVRDGLRFDTQARWVVSSTDAVVTIAGAGNAMRVQNKVI